MRLPHIELFECNSPAITFIISFIYKILLWKELKNPRAPCFLIASKQNEIQTRNSCVPCCLHTLKFNMFAFKIMFLFKSDWREKNCFCFKERNSHKYHFKFLDSSIVKQWQYYWNKYSLPRGTFWKTHSFRCRRPDILIE